MHNIFITNSPLAASNIKTLGLLDHSIVLEEINSVFIGGNRVNDKSQESITFQHGNYFIVFDGCIYNRNELKEKLSRIDIVIETATDEELLIKAYSTWGESAFNKINGMFSTIIYDRSRNEIICARDKLGVKPLYYEWSEGYFQACSQLKPLLKDQYELCEDAVSIYLSCGYVPSPYTILDGINKLQPGHVLKIDINNKTKNINQYWGLVNCKSSGLSYEEEKHKVHKLLKDAVKIRIDSEKDLGCFLSGGIDSALVTAIASKVSDKKIKTFTVGFEDENYDESRIAQQFSDILGTEHHIEILTKEKFLKLLPEFIKAYDEPFADSSAFPSLLLNKTTKNFVPIALAGDGGDEGFLGYTHFDSILKFKQLAKVPYFLRKIISKFLPEKSHLKHILVIKNDEDFIERIFLGNQELLKKKYTEWVSKFYSDYKIFSHQSLQKAADLNIKLWLENDSNVKVERASRAYGMEVRSPFLDYQIIELARSLPIQYRFSKGIRKRILKDILEIYIPRDVFEQPKRGFSIPLADWLRTVLKDDIELKLSGNVLDAMPNLNTKEFNKMLRLHFEGKKDYSSFIWRVYVLVLWMNNNGRILTK